MISPAQLLVPMLATTAAMPVLFAQVTDISPRGGRQRAIACSPRNPNLAISVRSDGQLLRSGDGGTTFFDVGVTIQDETVHTGFDASGVAFVATASGVRVSRDSGQTWTFTPTTIGGIHSFTVSPVTLDEVWALTVDGVVHRSSDGGVNWTSLGQTSPPSQFRQSRLILNPTVPSELYISDESRVWVSTDTGLTWTYEAFSGGTTKAFNAIGERWLSTFLIGGLDPYVDIGLTTDRGANWTYPHFISSGVQPAPMNIWQDPARPGEFHAYSIGSPTVYARSTDEGASWTSALIADQDLRFNDVAVPLGNSGRVLLSSRLGILQLDDDLASTSKAFLAQGDFLPMSIGHFLVSPIDANHRAASFTGPNNTSSPLFLESTDGGSTWSVEDHIVVDGINSNLTGFTFDRQGRILTRSVSRLLRKSAGGWEHLDPGHAVSMYAVGRVNSDLIVVYGSLADGTCAMSVSIDSGLTWTTDLGCNGNPILSGSGLRSIDLVERPGHPLRVVFGKGSGGLASVKTVYISDDLGATSTLVADDFGGLVMAQHPHNPESFAIGFLDARSVEISHDGLSTLMPSGAPVSAEELAITSSGVLVRAERAAGVDDVIYESTDMGLTWSTVPELDGAVTTTFSLVPGVAEDSYLVVGNHGVLERALDLVVSTNFCSPAVPNSTGLSAEVQAIGSLSVAANELRLEASDLPVGSATLFLASQDMALISGPGGSMGTLCLGGSIGRYAGDIQFASGNGAATLVLDATSIAQPNGSVSAVAGASWFFQAWYRDTVQGNATSNFTDGASLVWQP